MAINRHSSFRASSDRAQLSSTTWISNMLNGLHKKVKYQDPTIGQPNHDSWGRVSYTLINYLMLDKTILLIITPLIKETK